MTAKKKTIRITQVRSSIGYRSKVKATLQALGLRRMHQTVEQVDTPVLRGMLKVVDFLVRVEPQ